MSSFAKGNPFSLFFSGTPFFGNPLFSFFFLSPAKVGSLEMQPGAKLQAYLGVSMQPHACTQRFRLESFAGRGQMLDGRVLGASQVEYKPFGKPPLKREPSLGFGGFAQPSGRQRTDCSCGAIRRLQESCLRRRTSAIRCSSRNFSRARC